MVIVDNIGLFGSKADNYLLFKKVMEMFVKKEHLTKTGFTKIASLVYGLKEGKNRKLTLNQFLLSYNKN